MRATLMAVVVFLAVASSAYGAAKVYVANNGVDSNACGASSDPCRSITRAIANAAPGDTIDVGPGSYGDVNQNGVLGETGEEAPPTSGPEVCSCIVLINKAVTVVSSGGAAVTFIDGRTAVPNFNVRITSSDVRIGAPGYGFTITGTASDILQAGVVIDSEGTTTLDNVTIEGNRLVGFGATEDFRGLPADAQGIFSDSPTSLIQANEVIGWIESGIISTGIVRGNIVSMNGIGIRVAGPNALVAGNLVYSNTSGIRVTGDSTGSNNSTVSGNEVVGNAVGIDAGRGGAVGPSFTITGNNIYGNGCGIEALLPQTGLPAPDNYWGAPTGPGADPADETCGSGSVSIPNFATKPFKVKAL